jgi:predicted ester cyclase
MSVTANKELVRRYFEEAPGHPEVYDEILTASFQVHAIHHATISVDSKECGPELLKQYAVGLQAAWSANKITIDELIAEGDRVMARWTFHGIHTGQAFGVPPTGEPVTYAGINVFRIEDGRLAESWDIFDRLWIWQQMGVLPATSEFLLQARARQGQK